MSDMDEVWKDVVGYEGLYQVSNLGRVKSVEKKVKCKAGSERIIREKIMKQKTNYGYSYVHLHKNQKYKSCRVHRLVAQAFIPNPDDLPIINHKDEDRSNNTVENLEWCDHKYNINYGTAIERLSKKLLNRKDCSRPVLCVELNKVFPSIREAARFINITNIKPICVSIVNCCKCKVKYNGSICKTAYGYHWKYVV